MKTFYKIAIVLLISYSTFSCKKELAPLSVAPKKATLSSSSTYGQVTTVATGIQAGGLAVDAAHNLYASTGNGPIIYKITPAGTVTPFADLGPEGYTRGITFGPDSALYVTNLATNNVIEKITLKGVVTLFCGLPGDHFRPPKDGPLAQAIFYNPQFITSCADGNLYVTEDGLAWETPYTDIRVITPGTDGIVYTLYARDNSPAFQPWSIAMHQGIVYFSDFNSGEIAKIALDGTVSTFVTGLGQSWGMVFDPAGNLYVSDLVNNKIMKVTPDGVVSTLAGSGAIGSSDGIGANATFYAPAGLVIDGDYLYVGDTGTNDLIRKISLK